MIRMLQTPLPRTMEWLPATINEHIICQIPKTDRNWQMKGEMVSLLPDDLKKYRDIIESYRRNQLNDPRQADGRRLWVNLESFLRLKYEGRTTHMSYSSSSVMGEAFVKVAKRLLTKGRRPLIFADTANEADFLLASLRTNGVDGQSWADIAASRVAGKQRSSIMNKYAIVAVKSTEGQGINMQKHADAIICRPTPGDHLEQMKGRIDRPGQDTKELLLHVIVCEHTIEEVKFANIRLAGNFFREYIAPVATRYRERIDLEATLAAGGKGKLRKGTVSGAWRKCLEAAGQSGSFASIENKYDGMDEDSVLEKPTQRRSASKNKHDDADEEPKYKPLNKVHRNKGDPKAVREAKALAQDGHASLVVRQWLFPQKSNCVKHKAPTPKALPKFSLLRFSDDKPLVLNRETVEKAIVHLSKSDSKLAALIARVGKDGLIRDFGTPMKPTQALLFDTCLRAIAFSMVSVDAGNAFMRKFAIKIGVCLENISSSRRSKVLEHFLAESDENADFKTPEQVMTLLLGGAHNELKFTPDLVSELVEQCEIVKGKQTGYPVSQTCGCEQTHIAFLINFGLHILHCLAYMWRNLPLRQER